MNTWAEQMRFVRSIKGAAASILWILLLSGRACTQRELETATGYTDKPLMTGLALLEAERLIQYNGRRHGWSLSGGFYQLPLPFAQLAAGMALLDAPANAEVDAALPGIPGRTATPGASVGEIDRNNSDLRGIDRNYSDLRVLSSSSKNIDSFDVEEEEEATPARKNSELRELLASAGIGWHSPKMRELLALNLDRAYVEAHIAHRAAAIATGETYPVAWLINKLVCGDPAPTPPQKGRSLKQQIPDDLKHIIKH